MRSFPWLLLGLGLFLTVGSFSLSLVGGWTPCPYCLSLRYIGLVYSVLALLYALRPRKFLPVGMLVLALGAMGVSGYLIDRDLRRLGIIRPDPIKALTGADDSCAGGQECSTPVLAGLPASAYSLAGFGVLAAGTLVVLKRRPGQ